MGGSYYSFPSLILSTEKDCKTPVKLTTPAVANSAIRMPTNLGKSLRTLPSTAMRAGMTQVTPSNRKEESSLIDTSFLGEYECSSLALEWEGRDEKKRLDHLKQDQEMLVIKIFSERKKVFRERKKCDKIRAKRSDFLQGIEQYL
ncbi:hypothetical protein Tco_1163121 [Tanacetum coccineum]